MFSFALLCPFSLVSLACLLPRTRICNAATPPATYTAYTHTYIHTYIHTHPFFPFVRILTLDLISLSLALMRSCPVLSRMHTALLTVLFYIAPPTPTARSSLHTPCTRPALLPLPSPADKRQRKGTLGTKVSTAHACARVLSALRASATTCDISRGARGALLTRT